MPYSITIKEHQQFPSVFSVDHLSQIQIENYLFICLTNLLAGPTEDFALPVDIQQHIDVVHGARALGYTRTNGAKERTNRKCLMHHPPKVGGGAPRII